MPHLSRIKAGADKRAGVWQHARRFLILLMVAAIVSGNLLVKVKAAAGDLDTTFSADGKLRTTFGVKSELATDVAIQPDGKIVVAGHTFNGVETDFALARYLSDGQLDTSFSGDGKQVTDIAGRNDNAYAVAIQSDGKIVVAGETGGGGVTDFALVRYLSDGQLDTTFSGDGKVTTDFDVLDKATDMVIQPNGKIVLGGSTSGEDSDFALARYNSDGNLDMTFSGDGKQTTELGAEDVANAVALQPNGRIVLAGVSDVHGTGAFALARYYGDGSLDTNFSGDGKQTTAIGQTASGNAVAIQPDNRIVVAGYAIFSQSNPDFALARYNGNGSLDDGSVNDRTPHDMFGTNGIVSTDFFSSFDFGNAVAIEPDGKIVVAGEASMDSNLIFDFALARYNTDGTPDMTFSGDGKQTTGFASGSRDGILAIAIQTDGNIVAAGYVGKRNNNFDFGLARYLAN